jgi:hypothetical protein
MKFQNIPYEKMDIGIILKLANDFKITVKNETKETEIIKYEKDTIIGNGIVNIEIIQTKQKNDIEHYFFFKSFQMDSKINTQHIFYDKNILNNEKIGISDQRLEELNLSYEVDGMIIDITSPTRELIKFTPESIGNIKKYIKDKLQKSINNAVDSQQLIEIKKNIDKSKKEKQVNIEETIS